jgi:RimJ/RimL family protein N-acetyltransferase
VSLTWRLARASDRPLLERFTCTVPERPYYDRYRGSWHPAPWELEVQSGLRVRRPPLPPDEALLLGFDDSRLAAVAYVGFDTTGTDLIIFAVARAVELARRGYGLEAVRVALDFCQSVKTTQGIDVSVLTRLHPRNVASRKLLIATGFANSGEHDGDYELWTHTLA